MDSSYIATLIDSHKKGILRKPFLTFLCKICKNKFTTPTQLRRHLENIDVKITYFCPPCDGYFEEGHPCKPSGKRCVHCKQLISGYILNHLCFHKASYEKFHQSCVVEESIFLQPKPMPEKSTAKDMKQQNLENEEKFNCFTCGEEFLSPHYAEHISTCKKSGKTKVKCDICEVLLDSLEQKKTHYDSVHANLILFCRFCVELFDDEKEHEKETCGNDTLIAYCYFCKLNINPFQPKEHICFHICANKMEAELEQHIKRGFTYTCSECGKLVPLSLKIDHETRFHGETNVPGRNRTCKRCDIKFGDCQEYFKHKREVHDKRVCHICGKEMLIPKFKHHMNIHNNVKNFKCTQCDKTFFNNKDLRQHKLVHSDETVCMCCICGKGFKTNYNLKVHMRIHDEVKPFECVICKKTFTTKQWRDSHMKSHGVIADN